MKELIPRLVAMSLSAILFMTLSIKLEWAKRIWAKLNKKIKPQYNIALWLLCVCVFNIVVQILFETMGYTYNDIINGAIFGFSLAFMPTLGEKKL
jgi:hypothetical protein